MAEKSFFRKIGEFLGIVTPKKTPKPKKRTVVTPPKPAYPPKPRRTPSSELTVEQRVERYRDMNPGQRVRQRPQDEESEFWRLYDRG